jgi:hypothetical protein
LLEPPVPPLESAVADPVDRYLAPGRAYPVLVALAGTGGRVLAEKKCKFVDEQYRARLLIGAAVPEGGMIVAVKIRKGGGRESVRGTGVGHGEDRIYSEGEGTSAGRLSA